MVRVLGARPKHKPAGHSSNYDEPRLHVRSKLRHNWFRSLTHELTHGLGFDGELFPYFINSNGTQYGYDILVNATKRGKTVTMLASENVKARSRASFGCDTSGRPGTAGHWRRWD